MAYMNFQGPNFIMEVPTNWFITSSPQIQAMFLSPVVAPIRANLLISLKPLKEQATVQEVAAAAKDSQQQQYPQYQVIDEFDYTESGGAGIIRRYRWFNEQYVLQMQAFFLVDQLLFTLTATRAENLPDAEAGEIDSIFEHMITTFRIQVVPAQA